MRLTRCPQQPICLLSAHENCRPEISSGQFPSRSLPPRLLVAQGDTLDFFQLAVVQQPLTAHGARFESSLLDVSTRPRHLARLRLSSGSGRIQSAALSPSCAWAAVVVGRRARCYRLVSEDPGASAAAAPTAQPLSVTRIALPHMRAPALAVTLTDSFLVMSHPDGSLSFVDLAAGKEGGGVIPSCALQTVECHPDLVAQAKSKPYHAWRSHAPPVLTLATAAGGACVAAAGPGGVLVYRLPDRSLCTPSPILPCDNSPIAAIALSADAALLAVASASGKLRVYDVAAGGAMTDWTVQQRGALDALIATLPGSLTGVSFSLDSKVC